MEYTLKDDFNFAIHGEYKTLPDAVSKFKDAQGHLAPEHTDIGHIFFKYEPTGRELHYYVLDTDYEHYAFIWVCHNNADNTGSNQFAWVFSRTPTLDASVVDKVNAGITKYFAKDKFHTTVQDATS